MRTLLAAVTLTTALLMNPAPAFAWGPIGMNDAGCLVWDYDEVLDAGLTSLPDGGLVGPGGACLELVESTSDYLGKKRNEPFDAGSVPNPPNYTGIGIPSWDAGTKPLSPFGDVNLPQPSGICSDGKGWSFETGTWQGWTPFGAMDSSRRSPVYGNNVHIDRLKPPGYAAGMATTVGGDYWWFSRDVNQQGDYWLGSRDVRKDWSVFPGDTVSAANTGGLYSPTFVIGTDYLDFYLGGGNHVSQRVELQILPQPGWTQAQLLAQFDGIGVSEFPVDYGSLTKLDGAWVVVRASSPMAQPFTGENDFMGRHVGWSVKQFKNLSARLRFIDATRPGSGLANVNADHFRCTNRLDGQHVWLSGKVGHAVTPQPLWGTTDIHSHAAANVSFGGHLVWGDVQDPLNVVYDCNQPLQRITLADGGVLRPAITNPDIQTDCYMNFGMVLLANVVASAMCVTMAAGLAAIPFVGPILAAEEIATCTTAVAAATIGLLSSPVMMNRTLHGGLSPISGGLDLGDWLESIVEVLDEGNLDFHIQGVIESLDFDLPDGTHSGRFGRLHQQYQYQMVTRAWYGGLRLVVLDSINGRAMQGLLDQKTDYDDWEAIRDTVITARRLTACTGDSLFKVGPLCNIAEIAKTPAHARRIIAANKIAIVLGTEVDELGKDRRASIMKLFGHPNGTADSRELQLQDLYDWGIRKITPVHGIDNPLGGTGLFNDVYISSQQYHNLTRTQTGGTAGTWVDWHPGMKYALPMTLADPLAGLVLGTFTPGSVLMANPGVVNHGLPQVETTTPTETTIGGYSDITYRIGMGSGARPLTRYKGDYAIGNVQVWSSDWIPTKYWGTETGYDAEERSMPAGLMRVHNLGWIIGADPLGLGSTSRCSMDNAHLPMALELAEIAPASDNWSAAKLGHFNAQGITAEGQKFIRELMKKGIAFDLDHLSQKARLDAYAAAKTFADEAMVSSNYATLGIHTNFRGLQKSVPVPLEYRDAMGVGSETDRTAAELDLMRAHGGVVAPSLSASLMPTADFGSARNNCDFSSKAWSQKYLAFMKQLKGHGIAISTDMNGLTTPMASRFGMGACHTDSTFENKWQADTALVQNWPRDFTTAAAGCMFNTRRDGALWDPSCPSTKMLAEQHQEASAVIYDDYAGRVTATLSTTPLVQRVRARGALERRDDNGPRPLRDELVTIGGSRQAAPLKKFKNDPNALNTGWDYNVDGLKHVGLYPDFFQDIRNGGLTFEQLTPLFNAAEEYVRMWEKNCSTATAWTVVNGGTAPKCGGVGEPWPAL